MREIWRFLVAVYRAWSEDGATTMGAAIAYYALFSAAPLLLIVVSVAGLFFGEKAATGEVVLRLAPLIGEQQALLVQDTLHGLDRPGAGWAGLIGTGAFLFGATTVLTELQSALDRIWRGESEPPRPWWAALRSRALALGAILVSGLLLTASIVLSAGLAAAATWWWPAGIAPGLPMLGEALNFAISLALMTAVFAALYKGMPRLRLPWRDIWLGAGVAALLFSLGKTVMGWYIGSSAVISAFGAAGSVVALLLWVYFCAQVFLLGAEFTWVFAHRHGSQRGREPAPTVPEAPDKRPDAVPP